MKFECTSGELENRQELQLCTNSPWLLQAAKPTRHTHTQQQQQKIEGLEHLNMNQMEHEPESNLISVRGAEVPQPLDGLGGAAEPSGMA